MFSARGYLAAAISVLAFSSWAACAKGGSPAAPPAGLVRFDLATDPTTLDPLFMQPDASSAEAQLARLAFEPFVDLDRIGPRFRRCSRGFRALRTAIFPRRTHHRLPFAPGVVGATAPR